MKTDTAPDEYREFIVPKPVIGGTVLVGDPVGALEMAERLGVKDRSIHMARQRGQMPKPDYPSVNGSRAWEWSTILWWAGETDRLRTAALSGWYRNMFGVEPLSNPGNRRAPGVVTREDAHPDLPAVPSMP